MTTALPPTQVRRWVALCLFFLAPLVLLALAVNSGLQTFENREDTLATAQQLERYRQRLGKGNIPPVELASLSSVFVDARSRSLAEAEAQRRVVSVVEGASARLIESGAGDVDEAEAGEIVEVRVTFDADNPSLLQVLYSVETGMPLVNVEALVVRRLDTEASEDARSPLLRVDLTVRAHWKNLAP